MRPGTLAVVLYETDGYELSRVGSKTYRRDLYNLSPVIKCGAVGFVISVAYPRLHQFTDKTRCMNLTLTSNGQLAWLQLNGDEILRDTFTEPEASTHET